MPSLAWACRKLVWPGHIVPLLLLLLLQLLLVLLLLLLLMILRLLLHLHLILLYLRACTCDRLFRSANACASCPARRKLAASHAYCHALLLYCE